VASSPVLLRRAKSEEEAATPGQPVALARVSGCFPRRSALENHRLPLALPQSSGKVRNSHVSLNPLLSSLLRPARQKARPFVQKLWTLRLPCGRTRKTKKEFPALCFPPRSFNHLHSVKEIGGGTTPEPNGTMWPRPTRPSREGKAERLSGKIPGKRQGAGGDAGCPFRA